MFGEVARIAGQDFLLDLARRGEVAGVCERVHRLGHAADEVILFEQAFHLRGERGEEGQVASGKGVGVAGAAGRAQELAQGERVEVQHVDLAHREAGACVGRDAEQGPRRRDRVLRAVLAEVLERRDGAWAGLDLVEDDERLLRTDLHVQ